MSEPEPRRPRFRLQTLVLVVIILGLGAGLFLQRWQYEERIAEAEKRELQSEDEALKQRFIAEIQKTRAVAMEAKADNIRLAESNRLRYIIQVLRQKVAELEKAAEKAEAAPKP